MKLLEQMSHMYVEMTENEKRIYSLLKDDPKAFSLQSIGEVAEILDISKTTLMRFAKSLGFKGYADFRKKLQAEEVLDVSPAKKIKKILSSDYNLEWNDTFAQEAANMSATFENIDKKDMDTLVSSILETDTIYTVSWGISRHLSEMLALRLKMVGKQCHVLKRRYSTLLEEITHVPSGSLIIAFEFPPYARETCEALKIAKAHGAQIILVTDKPANPLHDLADLSFYCPTDCQFFGNSLIAPLFWVNLLTSQVIFSLKDSVMDRLETQRSILNNKLYYI